MHQIVSKYITGRQRMNSAFWVRRALNKANDRGLLRNQQLMETRSRVCMRKTKLVFTRFYSQSREQPTFDGTEIFTKSNNGTSTSASPFQSNSGTVIQTIQNGSPMRDALVTTVVGLCMVFAGGVAYVTWYKKNVLDKIEKAFSKGYDPALELATYSRTLQLVKASNEGTKFEEPPPHLLRNEQELVDRIIRGEETGSYFVLLGPKGTGKTTMIYDAMQKIQAEGVSMCEAHPDLEVFRLRLGKALNYEFNEDSQTAVFQRRDPREGGASLDIERALNKLEKVALRSARITGRPLVLIINNVHFFRHDEEGKNFLYQLQQRSEAWAESRILTMVFSSDDFWPFHVLRKSASRMQVLSIYDLSTKDAVDAAKYMRRWSMPKSQRIEKMSTSSVSAVEHNDEETFAKTIALVGGRMSYISKVVRANDMLQGAKDMIASEKAWLLSQIGLIPDCDDDVMDEQKWSSCSWLLLREFVRLWDEQIRERGLNISSMDQASDILVPTIPYWKCRQIMTRADFLDDLDKANIISIDTHHDVQLDSRLILHAAQEVVSEDGFDHMLDSVRERIDEIESLHRTRELTFKPDSIADRRKLPIDWSLFFTDDS